MSEDTAQQPVEQTVDNQYDKYYREYRNGNGIMIPYKEIFEWEDAQIEKARQEGHTPVVDWEAREMHIPSNFLFEGQLGKFKDSESDDSVYGLYKDMTVYEYLSGVLKILEELPWNETVTLVPPEAGRSTFRVHKTLNNMYTLRLVRLMFGGMTIREFVNDRYETNLIERAFYHTKLDSYNTGDMNTKLQGSRIARDRVITDLKGESDHYDLKPMTYIPEATCYGDLVYARDVETVKSSCMALTPSDEVENEKSYYEEVIRRIKLDSSNAEYINLDDPFTCFVIKKQIITGETPDNPVQQEDNPFEGLDDVEIDHDVVNPFKPQLKGMASKQLDGRIEDSNRYILALMANLSAMTDLFLSMEAEEAENRITASIVDIVSKIKGDAMKLGIKRMLKEIHGMNSDETCPWFIYREIDDKREVTFTAVTRKPIRILETSIKDSSQVADNEWANMGYGIVQFDYKRILGCFVGGTAFALSALLRKNHPHLSYNGNSGLCMGNMASDIIDSMRGKAMKVAVERNAAMSSGAHKGNSHTARFDNQVVDYMTKKLLSRFKGYGDEDFEAPEDRIQELSWFMTINDIRKYLMTVFSLLTSVDYHSPYVRINDGYIDDYLRHYNYERDTSNTIEDVISDAYVNESYEYALRLAAQEDYGHTPEDFQEYLASREGLRPWEFIESEFELITELAGGQDGQG